MSPEQANKGPFLSRIKRLFRKDGSQTPAEKVIDSETVNAELRRMKKELPGQQGAKPIDPSSAEEVRQVLSIIGVETQPEAVLTVSARIQQTGLTVLSIRDDNPNSQVDRVSVKLAFDATESMPKDRIDSYIVIAKDGKSRIIQGYEPRGINSLNLIHTLAQACLAEVPAKPQV